MKLPHVNRVRNKSPAGSMRLRARTLGRARQRGSAIVEAPFAVLFLILLLVLIWDLGRITPWAQQVAYSVDAGAQFAYRRYSRPHGDCEYDEEGEITGECCYTYTNEEGEEVLRKKYCYTDDITDNEMSFSAVETEIKRHVRSAVASPSFAMLPFADGRDEAIIDDDIEVRQIWRCSTLTLPDDSIPTETIASDEKIKVSYNDYDGGCSGGRLVLFIEVSVTHEFQPFTPYVKELTPEALRKHTFTISRQIF